MAATEVATDEQLAVCRRFGVEPFATPGRLKVGLARNLSTGDLPLNGLRHNPEGDTSGWYIWSGAELSREPEFFVPIHVDHLEDLCPQAMPYLALPPGSRFLVAPEYEDVWQDASLLVPET